MPRSFVLVDRISALVARAAAQAAALVLLSITVLILIEITLRSFFGRSTQITEEYVAYGLGTMVFLGLGHALRAGALVRVDLLLGRLGPAARRFFEIATCGVTLCVMSFVLYYLSVRVGRDFAGGTISMTRAATPMWIPHAIVAFGMGIFMLQVLVYMIGQCLGATPMKEQGAIE